MSASRQHRADLRQRPVRRHRRAARPGVASLVSPGPPPRVRGDNTPSGPGRPGSLSSSPRSNPANGAT
ncbi:hypothetical protein AAW14_12920 [Streptomyces hygroscopicus]|nr:hypothetical protein [Streptomyces hygroscopicus]